MIYYLSEVNLYFHIISIESIEVIEMIEPIEHIELIEMIESIEYIGIIRLKENKLYYKYKNLRPVNLQENNNTINYNKY